VEDLIEVAGGFGTRRLPARLKITEMGVREVRGDGETTDGQAPVEAKLAKSRPEARIDDDSKRHVGHPR
jgi:hypothetical protein